MTTKWRCFILLPFFLFLFPCAASLFPSLWWERPKLQGEELTICMAKIIECNWTIINISVIFLLWELKVFALEEVCPGSASHQLEAVHQIDCFNSFKKIETQKTRTMSPLTLIHFTLILSVIGVAKTTEVQDPQTKPTNQWGYNSMKAAESKLLGSNREMTNWLSAKGQTETGAIYYIHS